MNIAVIGTGYVGLVTGVSLAEVGHHVTCVDVDNDKISSLRKGNITIWEPGLEELLQKNITHGKLFFTTAHAIACENAQIIIIAVGTPENEDGSANLRYVEQAIIDIANTITHRVTIVVKSTVPVGTAHRMCTILQENLQHGVSVELVSNPEFLREGSAIEDAFRGDRIVIGADTLSAFDVMEEVYRPFRIPIYKTDVRSAEMIKYASNAFLATKISFINEIAAICEQVGANVDLVAAGMGMDKRIGDKFLKAGIGFGGSCFPKDTKALIQMARNVGYDFEILNRVVEVNERQKVLLVEKLLERFGSLEGKQIAVLGLSFKPNTNDIREAASITITERLIRHGAKVIGYDPIAIEYAKNRLNEQMTYAKDLEAAVSGCDAALILTEWDEIKEVDVRVYHVMKTPIVLDGRNCYPPEIMAQHHIEYHSIGRPSAGGQYIQPLL
ncbi:UDP-glucose dehydrogenase family protein [Ornithinibacillus xuwenensis]|uniref:UDP-glucose 6-dehydrogenase n=1 Tax=Ornithinibacillus xuwenensis TaxID=3144668 RepID=A0ABU9XN22_9BACI